MNTASIFLGHFGWDWKCKREADGEGRFQVRPRQDLPLPLRFRSTAAPTSISSARGDQRSNTILSSFGVGMRSVVTFGCSKTFTYVPCW